MSQELLYASEGYKELDEYFEKNRIRSVFLVCGASLQYLKIKDYFRELTSRKGIKITRFSDFQPNPKYESVLEGVKSFKKSNAECIVAIGGGSAMDVAKCVKLFCSSKVDGINGEYLHSDIIQNTINLLAIPTTAGTGSEATRYAVVYYDGVKQSITDNSIIPSAVLFDSSFLMTLPIYQKKSTVLDALCHAVESLWSVNSTDESKDYSKAAIKLVVENYNNYLAGDVVKNSELQEAAYIAGKAINITQTTAGHAMCYGLTSKFGISHGHAAALCVREIWPWMLKNVRDDICADSRGADYLRGVFIELAESFGCNNPKDGYLVFKDILDTIELSNPIGNKEDIMELTAMVNSTRLANNPVRMSSTDIEKLYTNIVSC